VRRCSTLKPRPESVSVPKLEGHALLGEGARLDGLPTQADDEAAGRAGALDDRFDDNAQELVDVVGGGKGLAEADGRFSLAPALGIELRQPSLELVGHLVEREPEAPELVAPVDLDAPVQSALGDCVGGVCQPSERVDDRPPDGVCHDRDQGDRDHQADQEPVIGRCDGIVDLVLGREERDGRLARAALGARRERAIADVVHGECSRARGGRQPGTAHGSRSGGDPALLEHDDVVVGIEAGALAQAFQRLGGERHSGDERADDLAACVDDPDLHSRGDHPRGPKRQSRRLEPHAGRVAEEIAEILPVTRLKRLLKGGGGGEVFGPRARRGQLLLVRRDHRAQPGLEPNVDSPRLAPAGHRVQSPACRSERQQRDDKEVGDELELEAHDLKFRLPADAADTMLQWIGRTRGACE
jgi:hypothetical protein